MMLYALPSGRKEVDVRRRRSSRPLRKGGGCCVLMLSLGSMEHDR
jgi:hypothetical protein